MSLSTRFRPSLATASLAAVALLALQATAVPPPPELLSRDSAGVPGNGYSFEGCLTPNARWIAFDTVASNLGTAFTTSNYQVVLMDRRAGDLALVSHGSSAEAGNGSSFDPCISANGRWIAYYSAADNLVAGDLGGNKDVFLYDRLTDETRIVSVNGDGVQANDDSVIYGNSLTPNGRWLVFYSNGTNLLPGADNGFQQVFLADLRKGTLSLLSADGDGVQGNGNSRYPSISPNGRYVAFQTDATNLIPGDGNASTDAVVLDLRRGTLVRASVATNGDEGNGVSNEPVVSNNGRYVAFFSAATNLVASDGNGNHDVFLRDTKAGTTLRISEPEGGGDATGGGSYECCMTSSGKTIAYYTYATNLNPDQASPFGGVYLYDVRHGTTRQVDLAPNGDAPDGLSYVWGWGMTPNGKYLLVSSEATQFTSGDTGGFYQEYLFQLR